MRARDRLTLRANQLVRVSPPSATEIEIGWELGLSAMVKGTLPGRIVTVLLDAWDVPLLHVVKSGGAGEHGHPEMARLEARHYNVVRGGGREALRILKELVDNLYDEHRGWGSINPYSVVDGTVEEWKSRAMTELATHPMQAFLLGQLFASEALSRAQGRPLVPEDRSAMDFLSHYHLNEVSSKFDNLKGRLRHELIAGVEAGNNPRQVARSMANAVNDYETDWGNIAITETARAETYGRLREYEDQGVDMVEGNSAYDSRVCPQCEALINGKRYPLADVIGVSNYGVKQDNWKPTIPLHPRCRCVWLPYEPSDNEPDKSRAGRPHAPAG